MHKAKHVSTDLAHSCHPGQDRKIMNHKGHLVSLFGQVLCVAQNPEARNVSSRVGVERVHESCRCQRTEKPLTYGIMNRLLENTPPQLKILETLWSQNCQIVRKTAYRNDESWILKIGKIWSEILKVGLVVHFESLRTAASTNSKALVNYL